MLVGLIPGLAIGAILVLLVRRAPEEPVRIPSSTTPAASPEDAPGLRAENARLKERISQLQAEARKAPASAEEAKPAEPAGPGFRELFAKLVEDSLTAAGTPKFPDTLQAVKAAGRPAVDFLMNALRTSKSGTERYLAAALLEGAKDPVAIPALAEALKSDSDEIVRTIASHALAIIGTEAAEAPLRAAATGDSAWGVRVNSAYGLAKRNQEDGLRILREAYESSTTPPEYRLAVLGGLADVAAPSTAPLFRQILSDTKDASYLLMSMAALSKMKDAESIPALERIQGSTQPDTVKQAAGKAIEAIRK